MKKKNINPKIIKGTTRRISPRPIINQQFSKEQELMQEMFAGESTLGAGHNLPQFNGALISGTGLINNEDYGETGSFFGINRRIR